MGENMNTNEVIVCYIDYHKGDGEWKPVLKIDGTVSRGTVEEQQRLLKLLKGYSKPNIKFKLREEIETV